MACEKCLDKMAKRYQNKLDKLEPKQRLGGQGKRLASLYGVLMTGSCQHEVDIVNLDLPGR